jgi:hypothetical protein
VLGAAKETFLGVPTLIDRPKPPRVVVWVKFTLFRLKWTDGLNNSTEVTSNFRIRPFASTHAHDVE